MTDPYYGPYCKGTTGQRICLDRVTEHCQAKDDCYKPPPPIGGFVLAGYSYGATFIDTKPLYERKLPPSEGTPTALTVLGDVIYATAGPNRLKVFDTVKPSALLLDEALATPPVMVDAAHLFGSLVPGEPTSFDIVLGDAKQVRWMTYSLYSFKKTQDIPFTLSAPWVTGAGPAAGPSMSSFHPFAERGIERIAIATTTPKNGLFWVQLKKPTPVVLGSADFTALATPAGEPVGVTTGFEKVWAATRAPNAVVQLNQDLMDKIKVMPLATRVPIAIDGAQGAPALATDNFYVMVLLEGGSGEPPELRAYFSGNLDPLKAIIFPIPEVRGEPVTMKTTYEGDKPTAWIATRSPNTILRLGFKGSSVSVDQVLNLPKEPVDLIVTSGAHDWSFNAKSALHVMMK